jgi:histidine kinase
MLELPDYIIRDQVLEGFRTKVYRGWSIKRKTPVLIKVPKHEPVSLSDVSGFVYEYDTTKDLSIEGIARAVELVDTGSILAIVIEDTGAIPLIRYTRRRAVEVSDFLDIALRLVETLGRLHRHGVIHRNINPENILIDPNTKSVVMTGLAAESPATDLKSVVEFVNPAYMAPEQTGLEAYGVDHRTDCYSLGIVFYELLTGRLPLHAKSPSEWIWAHTTQEPAFLHVLNPKVPKDLSGIIQKMLSKTPDDRYQSAFGLLRDLTACRHEIGAVKHCEAPAWTPIHLRPRFALSRKLLGREEHARVLRSALDEACAGGGGIVLVSGEAGIGKTMLVNEALRIPATEKAYYGYGKAGRIKQHTPYSLFVSAMEMVVRQLITDSERNLEIWKTDIQRALGRNGAVITELLPDVGVIIGPQPRVEALPPKEAQNRLFMTMGDLTGVFAKRGTPLVLFLDDLQWADMASLELLKYLSRNPKYFLIVGAYRDNEVNRDDPLYAFLRQVREATQVTEMHLDPLKEEDVVEFVADTLCSDPEKIEDLAGILDRKTYRNPLFLGQALKAAYDENVIRLNERTGSWEWDGGSLESLDMPGDVAELIRMRLNRLPKDTLHVLKLASCLGHAFNLRPLSIVTEKTVSELSALMIPAMREGLVLSVSEDDGDSRLEFVHDEIEKAVHSLFTEEERRKTHLRFGQVLLKEVLPGNLENMLLPIMDHVNRGLDLVVDPQERLRYASYNLQVGRKARSYVAYDSALSYFSAGKDLLPENAWDEHYRLCFDLYLECAQCQYMVGQTSQAEKLFDELIEHAKTEDERLDICGMKMLLYTGKGEYEKALKIGLNALHALGMDIPVRPGSLDYAKEMLQYKYHMLGKRIEDLAELPEMSRGRQRKVTEILVKLTLVTCSSYPELYSFVSIKAGNHALEYGSTEMAAIGYIGFAITEGSVLGNFTRGYELGKVAMAVVERYGTSFTKCIVYFTFGAIINHWTCHLKEGFEYLHKAVDYSLRGGEMLIAGWAYGSILEHKYLLGMPLSAVMDEAKKCAEYGDRVQHENLKINAWIYGKLSDILTNWSAWLSDCAWDREGLDEGDKAALVTRYFAEMQVCYLKGEWEKALQVMREIDKHLGAILGFMLSAECIYYHCLSISGAYPHIPQKERRRLMRRLKKDLGRLRKWADSSPGNFSHKYLLVRAEALRVAGKVKEAEPLYDRAGALARENGYVQDEAIASELQGACCANQGRIGVAREHINNACRLYEKWGATAKAQHLRTRYPDLVDESCGSREKGRISTDLLRNILADRDRKTAGRDDCNLDLIQEAEEHLVDQAAPQEAMKAFLVAVMDTVCANRGHLLLERGGDLFVYFVRDVGQEAGELHEPVRIDEADTLSKAIARFAFRTLRPVMVRDDHFGIFARDRYLRTMRPKSVACIPLLVQGTPVGVLYLENTLLQGVFTSERLELVQKLANRSVFAKTFGEFLKSTESDEQPMLRELLTAREIEILRLIDKGLSNKEIGSLLNLTVNTVKTHTRSIYGKLGVNGRVQAVKRGRELGYFS